MGASPELRIKVCPLKEPHSCGTGKQSQISESSPTSDYVQNRYKTHPDQEPTWTLRRIFCFGLSTKVTVMKCIIPPFNNKKGRAECVTK